MGETVQIVSGSSSISNGLLGIGCPALVLYRYSMSTTDSRFCEFAGEEGKQLRRGSLAFETGVRGQRASRLAHNDSLSHMPYLSSGHEVTPSGTFSAG